MKTIATAVLLALLALTTVSVPAARANDHRQIAVVSADKFPSQEYADFVGIFNSVLIELLKKVDEREIAARWGIFLLPTKGDQVTIAVIREGEMERPTLVTVLDENASFTAIHRTAKLVVETVRQPTR